jgi:hypothetical protein
VGPSIRWGNAWAETGRGVGLGLASFVQARIGFCEAPSGAGPRGWLVSCLSLRLIDRVVERVRQLSGLANNPNDPIMLPSKRTRFHEAPRFCGCVWLVE